MIRIAGFVARKMTVDTSLQSSWQGTKPEIALADIHKFKNNERSQSQVISTNDTKTNYQQHLIGFPKLVNIPAEKTGSAIAKMETPE